ncbi:MAG: 16S rRNA (guanine(527)-N(7))-methyltransferase RsmG [Candidatus Limnocylindria bacterium]
MSDAAAAALRELDRLLETDAPALRADLPPGFADAAARYVGLLLEANARLNLTRIVEPAAVARLHLLDALSALPLLDAVSPSRALDLGSGGGVPGIVLALARPDVSWTLVDSVRKKADALRSFASALGIANVAVVAERAELLGRDPTHRECHDLLTARACAPLPVLAEYALPLVKLGGAVIAWKGVIDDAELAGGHAAARQLGGIQEVRETGIGDRRFVVIRKVDATPDRFPRRPGQAAKRPLA